MKRLSEVLPWDDLSKKAYWDREISLPTWRAQVSAARPSYLPQAVAAFDPIEFIAYYGASPYKRDWPRLRQHLEPGLVRRRAPTYDLVWSRLVGQCWNLPPDARILDLPGPMRDFLVAVARRPGAKLTEVSAALEIDAAQAQEHARALMAMGLVRVEAGERLFPCALPAAAV